MSGAIIVFIARNPTLLFHPGILYTVLYASSFLIMAAVKSEVVAEPRCW